MAGYTPVLGVSVDLAGLAVQIVREQMQHQAAPLEDRAAEATEALNRATAIIAVLESELADRKQRLDQVVVEIESERK